MKKLLFGIVFALMLIGVSSQVFAICTVTFDKDEYYTTESISAAMACDGANEKNAVYELTWRNGEGTTLEIDTGTTPSTVSQQFYQQYPIPSDYAYANITATLTGTSLEGFDIAYVTNYGGGSAGNGTLVVSNGIVAGKWLGLQSSVKVTVSTGSNETGTISGGACVFKVYGNLGEQVRAQGVSDIAAGESSFEFTPMYDAFEQATDYSVEVACYCSSQEECVSGTSTSTLVNSQGSGTIPFTTNLWNSVLEDPLPVVYENGSNFSNPVFVAGYDTMYVRLNLSNHFTYDLKSIADIFMVNVDSGQLVDLNPESDEDYVQIVTLMVPGNSTNTYAIEVPAGVPSGRYILREFSDIYYANQLVTQGIHASQEFNVTGVTSIMTVNGVTIKDYWGHPVTTHESDLGLYVMPESNWTDPYVVLTEGFGYQICGNITSNVFGAYWHLNTLILHEAGSGRSYEVYNKAEGDDWRRPLAEGDNILCWVSSLPTDMVTASDWNFHFSTYLGDENAALDCVDCEYAGETQKFYIGTIEDSIVFEKWIEEPTAVSAGVPATFIVTEREEALTMNDDCEYKTQSEIPWGSANVTCYDKDDGSPLIIDYDVYPIAGEEFRVCYQIKNYLSEEIALELYDIYLDDDSGETVVYYDERTENYVPSIQDGKVYLSETPSRATELNGALIDGYSNMCSKWLEMPLTVEGGNDWDIQGKVSINTVLYDLINPLIWRWETDEFPVFGREEGVRYPDYITINDFGFTYNNVSEGEFVQFYANITNNLPYDVSAILHGDLLANWGGQPEKFHMYDFLDRDPFNSDGQDGEYLHTRVELTGSQTVVFQSERTLVPYGFRDTYDYDVLRASLLLHVVSEEGGEILWTQAGNFAPTIEVISKGIAITNISASIDGAEVSACTPYTLTLTYDDVQSDTSSAFPYDERYVIKECTEDTTTDYYFPECSVLEIQPDKGVGRSSTFYTSTNYIPYGPIEAEIDLWVYSYDADNTDEACLHCGDLVDFISGDDYSAGFNLTFNGSDSCKYRDDKDMELDLRQTSAWESISTSIAGIWSALLNWMGVGGTVGAESIGNYTNVSGALTAESPPQLEYNVTAEGSGERRNLHFVYEFAPVADGDEGGFVDQNPYIQGYQALSLYQAMPLNTTKKFTLTLSPQLEIGTYKMYETIYEVNTAQPVGAERTADERLVYSGDYTINVTTDLEPTFDGDIIQIDGVVMQALS